VNFKLITTLFGVVLGGLQTVIPRALCSLVTMLQHDILWHFPVVDQLFFAREKNANRAVWVIIPKWKVHIEHSRKLLIPCWSLNGKPIIECMGNQMNAHDRLIEASLKPL